MRKCASRCIERIAFETAERLGCWARADEYAEPRTGVYLFMALGCRYGTFLLPGREHWRSPKWLREHQKPHAQLFLGLFRVPLLYTRGSSIDAVKNWSTQISSHGYISLTFSNSPEPHLGCWLVFRVFWTELVPLCAKHFHNLFSQSIIKSRWLVVLSEW